MVGMGTYTSADEMAVWLDDKMVAWRAEMLAGRTAV